MERERASKDTTPLEAIQYNKHHLFLKTIITTNSGSLQAGDAAAGTVDVTKLVFGANGTIVGSISVTVGPQKDSVQANFSAHRCAGEAGRM